MLGEIQPATATYFNDMHTVRSFIILVAFLKMNQLMFAKKEVIKKSSPPISPRQARNAILTVKLYIPKFLTQLGYSLFPCVNVALFLTGGGTSSVKVRP